MSGNNVINFGQYYSRATPMTIVLRAAERHTQLFLIALTNEAKVLADRATVAQHAIAGGRTSERAVRRCTMRHLRILGELIVLVRRRDLGALEVACKTNPVMVSLAFDIAAGRDVLNLSERERAHIHSIHRPDDALMADILVNKG